MPPALQLEQQMSACAIIESVKKPEIRYLLFHFCIIITLTDDNHLQNFKYCVMPNKIVLTFRNID